MSTFPPCGPRLTMWLNVVKIISFSWTSASVSREQRSQSLSQTVFHIWIPSSPGASVTKDKDHLQWLLALYEQVNWLWRSPEKETNMSFKLQWRVVISDVYIYIRTFASCCLISCASSLSQRSSYKSPQLLQYSTFKDAAVKQENQLSAVVKASSYSMFF